MNQKTLFKEYEKIFQQDENEAEKSALKNTKAVFAYSPFALQDAVGEKNVKKAWIEYQKLRSEDIEAEELIFKIVSKVRDMLSIIKGALASDLGIKDFPYNKSKKDSKNWKKEELEKLYTELVFAFHGSRMGGDDLDLALEKILLKL